MKNFRIYYLVSVFSAINFCCLAESWEELGERFYLEGHEASLFSEREKKLNLALQYYLESDRESNFSSHIIQERIGDLFLDLNEISWALLYYLKAYEKSSFDLELKKKITSISHKLEVPPLLEKKEKKFYFLSFLFFILSLSFAIWYPSKKMFFLVLFSSFLFLSLTTYQIYLYYYTPLRAIMINSSALYLEPDFETPQLRINPLTAGSSIGILKIEKQGTWIKIIDQEKHIGFVPLKDLRIIS